MDEKSDFKAKLGDIVQLQYTTFSNRERLNAKVIGYAPNKSLILSAPVASGQAPFLQEKQKFIVRMVRGIQVFAFESEVIKYLTSPYAHVHLSQPKKIEAITVRNSRRVNTETVISVQPSTSDALPAPATMLNTSLTGALIKTDNPLGEIGDNLILSSEFAFHDFQKYLRLNAIIRNVIQPDNNADAYRYGVEFQGLDDDQKLIIHGYVYNQIVKEMEE
ncbi:MAG: flagellar brake protein [Gammaproteobacteria bacterium]|nr:flagellar brake protein [Gammaproteobacteria bacterium]MDH5735518.1 flagellar brake protein [Gammaproteobacteria bacterium]